jgi:DtxR family transcriptional regulator, Mn-dependent transcriptional regulator
MLDKIKITRSHEDCLETIFFLKQKNDVVRITDVALALAISKPSVTKVVHSLKTLGYVQQEHYGTLTLTVKGTEMAVQIAKSHTVIKKFLINVLHVDEITAEKEACLIEHAMGRDTVSKLEAFLDTHNNIK